MQEVCLLLSTSFVQGAGATIIISHLQSASHDPMSRAAALRYVLQKEHFAISLV